MSGISNRLYQTADLRQEMKINPRLYQAMELLHMPLLDLEQHLKQQITENPFLELVDPEVSQEVSLDETEEREEKSEQTDEDEIDWEEILLNGFDEGGRVAPQEVHEYREPIRIETRGLQDHLMEQLRHLPLSEREVRLGEEIIGNIDDSGLLSCCLEAVLEGVNAWLREVRPILYERAEQLKDEEERAAEIAELEGLYCDYDEEEAVAMLSVVQEMDPAGVGARDLRECILVQFRRLGEEDSPAASIVRDHFDDLLNHRWNEIARSLSLTPRAIQDAADEVARLNPKPGLPLSGEDEVYILPDMVVDKIDGGYRVFLNDTTLPRLRLSRSYREVARDRNQYKGENRDFIAQKLNSANWMIQAIEQRRQTMLKVMNFIVDRQAEFFERGVQYLRPLTLREVADHIDMHESTVSRVTNEKWVQTPRGVLPLKYFFSSGLSTASGEDISARGVKDKIRTLVQQENARKPLTDQRIVELLEADGIQIARRTVAKYRDQLGLLPARMRKRV